MLYKHVILSVHEFYSASHFNYCKQLDAIETVVHPVVCSFIVLHQMFSLLFLTLLSQYLFPLSQHLFPLFTMSLFFTTFPPSLHYCSTFSTISVSFTSSFHYSIILYHLYRHFYTSLHSCLVG